MSGSSSLLTTAWWANAVRVFMNGPEEVEQYQTGEMPPAVEFVPYNLFPSPGRNSVSRRSFSSSPTVREVMNLQEELVGFFGDGFRPVPSQHS